MLFCGKRFGRLTRGRECRVRYRFPTTASSEDVSLVLGVNLKTKTATHSRAYTGSIFLSSSTRPQVSQNGSGVRRETLRPVNIVECSLSATLLTPHHIFGVFAGPIRAGMSSKFPYLTVQTLRAKKSPSRSLKILPRTSTLRTLSETSVKVLRCGRPA